MVTVYAFTVKLIQLCFWSNTLIKYSPYHKLINSYIHIEEPLLYHCTVCILYKNILVDVCIIFLFCIFMQTVLNTALLLYQVIILSCHFFAYIIKVHFFFDWLAMPYSYYICPYIHTQDHCFQKFKFDWSLWVMTPPPSFF